MKSRETPPAAFAAWSLNYALIRGCMRWSANAGANFSTAPHHGHVLVRSLKASGAAIVVLGLACERPSEPDVSIVLEPPALTSQFTPPSPDPSGVAYLAHLNSLVIADGEVEEMSIYAGANMFETTLSRTLSRTWTTIPASQEPTGVTYNPANRHVFLSDDNQKEIYEVNPGPDAQYGTSDDSLTHFDTEVFGSSDPEGVAFDIHQRVLFIADGYESEIFRVAPGANGVFDGVPPIGDDQVSRFDTQSLGLTDPEGIAYDSDLRRLYVVGRPFDRVFQLSTAGMLLGTFDITAAAAVKPAGLEYVRVGSSIPSLYMVDRGVDNDTDPTENDGKLHQFTLSAVVENNPPSVTIKARPSR